MFIVIFDKVIILLELQYNQIFVDYLPILADNIPNTFDNTT